MISIVDFESILIIQQIMNKYCIENYSLGLSLCFQAHWQNARNQRYAQILPKSLPAHRTPMHEQNDIAKKMKDDLLAEENRQLVTMYKNNSRNSSKFRAYSPLQQSFNLTVKCHAFGYYFYTNR